MKKKLNLLAFDLGAESGRSVLAEFDGKKITSKEIDRFLNEPVVFQGTLYWDVLRLMLNIKKGINTAVNFSNGNVDCIGVSSWGVDFCLIAKDGSLIQNAVHYRDKRTLGQAARVMEKVSRETILSETGYQIFEIAALFQLNYLVESGSWVLDVADRMLMIADLINYYLTGSKLCEYTLATTSGLYNPVNMCWSRKIIEPLGIPLKILPEVVQPGKKIGALASDVGEEFRLRRVPVVTPACHDTASAIAATPLLEPDSAFISCGTWTVLGIETKKPIFDRKAFDSNFLNEGGVDGTMIFVKNLTGLWILQCCRREWQQERGTEISWNEIIEAAKKAHSLACFIDTDDESFLRSFKMTKAIYKFCRNTGQFLSDDIGSVARCCIDSLAMKYKQTYMELVNVVGKTIKRVHMVGGGSRNALLCQSTSNALGLPLFAGPAEAAALGNVMMQATGIGEITDVREGRKIILASDWPVQYEPQDTDAWENAFRKYLETCRKRRKE